MTNNLPLDQLLQQKRKEFEVDFQDIEKNTKISKAHLIAIEKKNFKALPPEIYTKNIIKSYAAFLNINDPAVIEQFINEYTALRKQQEESERLKTYMNRSNGRTIDIPKLLKIFIILCILGITVFYLYSGIKKIFQPPFLEISQPLENKITTEQNIVVRGKTQKGIEILINQMQILSDENGSFEKEVILNKGVNQIEITAKNSHGKTNTITRTILFQPPEDNPLPNANTENSIGSENEDTP